MVRERDGGKWSKRVARRLSTVRADLSLAIIEAGLVIVAYAAALGLRSLDPTEEVPASWWTRLGLALPVIIFIHLGANLIFGNYGHVWRFASIEEAMRLVAAAMTAGLVMIGVAGLYQHFVSPQAIVPLSVLVLGAFLSLGGMGALRFWSRLVSRQRINELHVGHHRAVIVGVGTDAVRVARHRSESTANLAFIGFIDPSAKADMSRTLAGYPILGGGYSIPELVKSVDIS
ncbi:MAG: hypothetical protein KDB69_09875 [Acidimicrobiia bacterium]|nr:hypothetical protein [Acidimicrobiia bacterium]